MYLYARKSLNFLSFKAHTDRERDSITRREFSVLKTNKTLYRALTRWGYANTHITVHDTYMQYTAISIKI